MDTNTTTTKMGRKRTLPEGARITSFSLTEEERLAVKKFIVEMRREKKAKELADKPVIKVEDFSWKLLVKVAEEVAYAMITIAGTRRSFAKVERLIKDAAIIGFKDAVGRWENENPLKYDENGKQVKE